MYLQMCIVNGYPGKKLSKAPLHDADIGTSSNGSESNPGVITDSIYIDNQSHQQNAGPH